ncbi:hypothetical protein MKX01_010702 [Papaver californicum]|nr:hypothetical protein MKX01_010702 [Papaver californicum]
MVVNGFQRNEYIAPKFVAACAVSKVVWYARKVFDQIAEPSVFLCNSILKGYSENDFYKETLLVFNQMKDRDVKPNCFTFPFVIKSCKKLMELVESKKVHCFVIKAGFQDNPFISISMIDLYSTLGEVKSARTMFDVMPERNIVAWTTMIAGYNLSGDIENARTLFDLTPDRDDSFDDFNWPPLDSDLKVIRRAETGTCMGTALFPWIEELGTPKRQVKLKAFKRWARISHRFAFGETTNSFDIIDIQTKLKRMGDIHYLLVGYNTLLDSSVP